MSDKRLVCKPPLNLPKQRIDPRAFAHRAAIVTEGELGEVAIKMLAAYPMMDAVDLALEQTPGILQAIRVDEVVLHILADRMVDSVEPVAKCFSS